MNKLSSCILIWFLLIFVALNSFGQDSLIKTSVDKFSSVKNIFGRKSELKKAETYF